MKEYAVSLPTISRPAAIVATSLALMVFGCASAPGPAFSERPTPESGRSLLYVYRLDRVNSAGSATLKINGQKVGKLKHGEYLWLEVPPGDYEISLRYGGFPWSMGWSKVQFQARGPDARFMRLEADALRIHTRAGHLEDDARGARRERYSVNLYHAFIPSDKALPQIRQCHATGNRPD